MNNNLDLGLYKNIFAVPSDIVDKYLKSLNGDQVKILLCFLRLSGSNDVSADQISNLSGVDYDTTQTILNKIKSGEIFETNQFKEHKTELAVNDKSLKINKRYLRPDASYIANRIESSKEIYFLMQEAQVILGRPLSNGDSAMMLALHDNDGLPPDVILMLIQYAVSEGKSNMKYILKVGESWAKDNVFNIEKAEKKIKELSLINIAWKRFESIIGIEHRAPTSCEEETINRWINIWNFNDDMIKEAYDRCVNRNGKYVLKYMDSIIKRWQSQGIVRIEDALAENAKHLKSKKETHDNKMVSYDIDEYEKYSILDYIN